MKEDSPTQQVESKGWFSGLISSAGKILSSVFLNDDDDSSCSSYSDSCSDFELVPDLDECRDASHRDDNVTNQPGTELENAITERRPVDSPGKTKFFIEKLLQQESYSRDESKRLMEIIQSRVVRPPMTENIREEIGANFPKRKNYEGTASPRTIGLSRQNYSLGESPCSPGYVSTFHTKSSADQTCNPHTTSMAIKEGKKWVDGKRLSSSSNSRLSCGPCVLNTDMLQSEIIRDGDSPLDAAKSYMQALPRWRSPITSSFGFRIPSTVGHKRSHIKDESGDFLEATRSVCQRTEEMSSSRFFRTYVRSKKGMEPGYFLNSLEAGNRMGQVHSATENVFDDYPHGILGISNANTNRTNLPISNNGIHNSSNNDITTDGIHTSSNSAASTLKETKNVQRKKRKCSARGKCSAAGAHLQSKTKIQNASFASNHDISVEDQAGAIVVHKGCVGDTLFSEHKGSLVEYALNTEAIMTCTLSIRNSSSTEDNQNGISMQILDGSIRSDNQQCGVTMRSIKHMLKEQHPLNSDNGRGRGRKTLSRSRRGRSKVTR